MKINENCRSFMRASASPIAPIQHLLYYLSIPLLLLMMLSSAIAAPVIGVSKEATAIGRQVTFDFYLENLGDTELTSVAMPDDLDAVFGAGNYSVISAPIFLDNPGTLTLNASYDGSGDTAVISGGTLAVGDTAQIRVVVEISTIADVGGGLGNYSNQVTATATGTSDVSDAGNDPDPNGNGDPGEAGEDDPTQFSPIDNPVIGVSKTASVSGSQVTFDFYLEAFGNRTLTNLSLVDDLDAVFGAGNYSVTSAPTFIDDPGTFTLNAGFDGSSDAQLIASGTLSIADTAQIRVVVNVTNVTDQGSGVGVYSNQATASAQSPFGKTTSDLSDNGTDPDPDGNGQANQAGENDPTLMTIGEEPKIGIATSVSVSGSEATFDYYVENLGNVALSNVQVEADLDAVFGAGNYYLTTNPSFIDDPGTLTLNPSYNGRGNNDLFEDGGTLSIGDTAQIRYTVRILTLADLGSGQGVYQAQATASAEASGGGTTQDISDNGTDPDPNGNGDPSDAGENDPTPITIARLSSIGMAKTYRATRVSTAYDVEMEYRVENLGNVPLNSITISENLNSVYGAGNFIHLQDPTYVDGSPTFNYNAAFNGNTNTSLLNGGSSLDPGEYVVFKTIARVINLTDQGFGVGVYQTQNTANALDDGANPVSDQSDAGKVVDSNGNGDAGDAGEDDPLTIDLNTGLGFVGLALDASVAGNLVTFDVYLENLDNAAFSNLSIFADLDTVFGAGNYVIQSAPQFIDDPGSVVLNGTYDGSSVTELLDLASSSLAAGDTAQIRMVVNVTNITNQGLGGGNYSASFSLNAQNPSGGLVSDVSDFGTDPDPNGNANPNEGGENDATTASLNVADYVGVALNASVANKTVTLDLYLENLGVGTLSNVNLDFGLNDVFGAGNYTITTAPNLVSDPGTLVLNGAYDGNAGTNILAGSSTLAAGASAQIQLVVELDSFQDVGNGFGLYNAQAKAVALTSGGLLVSDFSDSGTDPDPNGNGDPTEAGEDDPTAIVANGNPAIGLSTVAYVNGTQVRLRFIVENLGDVGLSNLFMEVPLNPVFGSGNYSIFQQPQHVEGPGTLSLSPQYFGFNIFSRVIVGGTLDAGEREVFETVINVNTVSDQGNGFGIYHVGPTVTAASPNGSTVSDVSDSGFDPDPNGNGDAGEAGENDVTVIIIGDEANLGVALDASVTGKQVTLDFYLENFGNSALSALDLKANLDAVFGSGNYSLNSAPTLVDDPGTINLNAGYNGASDEALIGGGSTLAALDTAQIRVVVDVNTVTDLGAGLGQYTMQVKASANAPLGSYTEDYSDFGTDPDPNGNSIPNQPGEDDPTSFQVGLTDIGVAVNVNVVGDQVFLDYYLSNLTTAAATITDVSILADLDAVFGSGNYSVNSGPTLLSTPRNLVLNTSFDGSVDKQLIASGSIGPGVTEQIRVIVDIIQLVDMGSGLGVYSHQVAASGQGPDGPLSDLSDSGTDPDPNGNGDAGQAGEDDPSAITVAEDATVGAGLVASVSGRVVTLDLYLESFANVTGSNLSVPLDLDSIFGSGNYSITTAAALIDDPGTIVLNGSYDGSGDTQLLGSSTLVVNDTAQIRLVVEVTTPSDQGFGAGIYQTQVTVSSDGPSTATYTDLSDSAVNPDTNGNDNPDETGENDVTSFELESLIAGVVWNDLDGDGVVDAGEPFFAGATLFLDENSNSTLDAGEATATTQADGSYSFTGLAAGVYSLVLDTAIIPSGFVGTQGAIPTAANLTAGQELTGTNFGFQQRNATIGDFVWNDLDGDGVQDGGEPGLSGVTIYLDLNGNGVLDSGEPNDTSDGSGAYDITALPAGNYTVRVDTTSVPSGFVLTGGTNPVSVGLAAGQDYNTADFGYQQQDASIGDFVWNDLDGDGVQDGGEPGLSGVTIYLDLNGNGVLDGGEPSDTSDGAGAFDITALPAGNYTVRVDTTTVSSGFVLTGGSNPVSVSLAAGQDYNTADFGYQQQDASIGDFVWNDLDGNGVQDGGEPGLSGVTVFLDLNTNGVLDGGEPSDVTDASGAYDFTDLATGTYSVRVDETTVTTGFVLTGGTNPVSVNLAAGQDYNDADFGYQQQDATIGDFVWNDLDGDGVQDAGEPGLAGVTVFLDLNSNSVLDSGEPSDVTDASGAYDFTALPTGAYSVRVDATSVSTGFVLTGGTNPVSVNLAAGEDYNDADFGYQQQDATIGDFVWNDLDGDGVQDGGEPGLAGVTVFLDLNTNGVLDSGEPSDTTDGAGAYDITDLATGTYSVRVDETTVTTGFVLTGGTNPVSVNLAAGQDYNDADFGYQQQDATIGDFVWNDLDGDGVQDGGEPGLAGVTIFLDTNTNGVLDAGEETETTDANGAYDFTDLPTGTYSVRVDTSTVTTGFVLTGGANPVSVNLAAGQDYNDADFGYQQQDATIGDLVWEDLNGDGVKDASEVGLAGVTVFLDTNTNGILDGGESSDITDASGAYDFTDLPTGTYSVRVDASTVPAGYVLTTSGNPLSVNLAAGEDYNDADFGYQKQVDIAMTVDESTATVVAGSGTGNLVYTVTATNNGPAEATNLEISNVLTLPAGVTTDSVVPSAGSFNSGVWTIGSLAASANATLTVTLTVDETTTPGTDVITNAASVTSVAEALVSTSDDSASESTSVRRDVDIVVSNSADIDVAVAGSSIGNQVYTVEVTNNGPSNATGLVIRNVLTIPAGVTLDSVVPSKGSFTDPDWTIGDLASGETETLVFTMTVESSAATGTDVMNLNSGVQTVNENLVNTTDDGSIISTDILRNVDLAVTVTESVDPVIAGSGVGNLVYTVTVVNNGPSDASGVKLSNVLTLPSGVTVESAVPSLGSVLGNEWTVGDMVSGASETLIVTLTAANTTAEGTDTISDQATVTAANEQLINTGDDTFTESTSVLANIEIEVVAQTVADPLVAGGIAKDTFVLTVTNKGPSIAADLVLGTSLVLPADVSLTGHSTTGATSSYNTVNGEWSIPSMAVNESATLTLTVQAGAAAAAGENVMSLSVDSATAVQIVKTAPEDYQVSTASSVISVSETTLGISTALALNPQTGLIEGRILVTNNNPVDVPAFRVYVTNLPADVTLMNASGYASWKGVANVPYFLVNTNTAANGGTQELIAQYLRANRDAGFDPLYEIELLDQLEGEPVVPVGVQVALTRNGITLSDQGVLIEWVSVPGKQYYVQYSADMVTWKTVAPTITAYANATQWTDQGLPGTESHPSTVPQRFYRVFEIINITR